MLAAGASKVYALAMKLQELCTTNSTARKIILRQLVKDKAQEVQEVVIDVADLADLGWWILAVKLPSESWAEQAVCQLARIAAQWATLLQNKFNRARVASWKFWVKDSLIKGAGPAHKWSKQSIIEPMLRQVDGHVVTLPPQLLELRAHRWSLVWAKNQTAQTSS